MTDPSVRDNCSRTNNVLESYHASQRSRIQVTHPNIYCFLSHQQNVTVDSMTDEERVRRGVEIRRPKKKRNLRNDVRIKACIDRYDNGSYSRLQFYTCHTPQSGLQKVTIGAQYDEVTRDSDRRHVMT